MTERVVLAYSGGLDTSVAIGWLAEKTGAEVIAVAVDVGQGGEDLDVIRQRALDCGAVEAVVVDARDEFAAEYCLPALRANALYMDRYPLVSALSRPLIVKHLVAAASRRRHDRLARLHRQGQRPGPLRGRPGRPRPRPQGHRAGPRLRLDPGQGDRVRRGEGPADRRTTKKTRTRSTRTSGAGPSRPASWRTSGTAPIEDVYAYTADPAVPREPTRSSSPSTQGVPVAIDGRPLTPYQIIAELNQRAGAQGVGRIDMVEDRLVGIKSREIYEAPGAIALITAHQELENVTVERDLARFKRGVDQRWGELVYDGLWFSPLKQALDAFIAEAQKHVTGDIRMTLHGGRAVVTGRRSRGVAVRLRPGHLRHRRHLRPVAGQGLRRAVGPAQPRSPRRATPSTAECALSSRRTSVGKSEETLVT